MFQLIIYSHASLNAPFLSTLYILRVLYDGLEIIEIINMEFFYTFLFAYMNIIKKLKLLMGARRVINSARGAKGL